MDRQTSAYAIFTSILETDSTLAPGEIRDAVEAALRLHQDLEGCVAAAATAFGDDPAAAARRMRWALATTERLTAPEPRPAPTEVILAAVLLGEQFPRAVPVLLVVCLVLMLRRRRTGVPRRMYDSDTARE